MTFPKEVVGMENYYSDSWRELFLRTIPPEQTLWEVAFLARHLPLSTHRRILDLCCGTGRHAEMLAKLGYQVTGVDVSEGAIAEARGRSAGGVDYRQHDMRDLATLPGPFDAVLCL